MPLHFWCWSLLIFTSVLSKKVTWQLYSGSSFFIGQHFPLFCLLHYKRNVCKCLYFSWSLGLCPGIDWLIDWLIGWLLQLGRQLLVKSMSSPLVITSLPITYRSDPVIFFLKIFQRFSLHSEYTLAPWLRRSCLIWPPLSLWSSVYCMFPLLGHASHLDFSSFGSHPTCFCLRAFSHTVFPIFGKFFSALLMPGPFLL